MAIKGRVLLSQEDPPTGRIDLKSRQDKLSSQLKGVTKGTKTVKKHKIFPTGKSRSCYEDNERISWNGLS